MVIPWIRKKIRERKLLSVSVLILVVMFGLVNLGTDTPLGKMLLSPAEGVFETGETVTVQGIVDTIELSETSQTIWLKAAVIQGSRKKVTGTKLLIYDSGEMELLPGNKIQVQGRLTNFERERNPGGFDQKQYYQLRKISCKVQADSLTIVDGSSDWLRGTLYRFRTGWKRKLMECVGEEDGAVLAAMLLADKKQVDSDLKELYQQSGIAHILAISGLHLSFVGMGIYRIIRKLSGSYPVSGAVGMVFLLLYILMIGCSVSALRALIMYCFDVGADMSGRTCDGITTYGAAAAIVVLWRPFSFYDAAFQLSFGAIGGIYLFRNFPGSLAVTLATFPIIIYHYYEFPLYSIVLNLAVIPLMSVLLFLGLVGSVVCQIVVPLGGGVLTICTWILRIYELLCHLAEKLPYHRIVVGRPALSGILIYYGCLILFVSIRKRRSYRKAVLCRMRVGILVVMILTACGSMVGILFSLPSVRSPELEIVVLDVGQGDGIFLREKGGLTCLVDGGSSDVSKVGRYRIEPFLKERGVGCIDYVFVSHGDQDHMSGLSELIERQERGVQIRNLVFPERSVWDETLNALYESAVSKGIRCLVMMSGDSISGDELTIRCLAPVHGETYEPGNEASMVLAVSYGELELLLTGDVEGEGEEQLLEVLRQKEIEYDILKVAHHGSKNSTSKEFLRLVNPRLACISAGQDNRYGHPHKETLDRLSEQGTAVICTAKSGAIILRMDGKEVENISIIQYNSSYEKFE